MVARDPSSAVAMQVCGYILEATFQSIFTILTNNLIEKNCGRMM
jgi:hypothetical protein